MKLRFYDLHKEGPGKIFSLFERVYGSSSAIRQRWHWEWVEHPEADRIAFAVAESEGQLVGLTVRMPMPLLVDGKPIQGWFATNSMVDPSYRGQGLIKQLYDLANGVPGVHLSKGTAAPMYRQLLRLGYRPVTPDSYQVCLLTPWRWLVRKLRLVRATTADLPLVAADLPGGPASSAFTGHVSFSGPKQGVIPLKTTAWLNWRYGAVPHKKYLVMQHRHNDSVQAWLIYRLQGQSAIISDCWCEEGAIKALAGLVGLLKQRLQAQKGSSITTWVTGRDFRRLLLRKLFFPVRQSPRFSYHSMEPVGAEHFSFAHGDGDLDYL